MRLLPITMFYAQILLNGITIAAYLSLMAVGLTLIFGVLRIVNFVHGVMLMLGAYIAYLCTAYFGANGYYLSLIVSAAGVGILGILLNATVFHRFAGNLLGGAVISIALSLFLQNLAWLWFGGEPKRVVTPFQGVARIGDLVLSQHRLFVIVVAVLVMLGLHLLIRYTRIGRAVRASEQDAYAASLMGIDMRMISYATFGVGGALAGLAGAMIAPTQLIMPNMGTTPLLLSFVVIILGGMGSIGGALFAALLVGIAQSAITTLWSPQLALGASFLIAMIMLVIWPTGLFGRR